MVDAPVGTVMSRLHRGRRRLQATLLDVARKRATAARIARPDHRPLTVQPTVQPADLDTERRSVPRGNGE